MFEGDTGKAAFFHSFFPRVLEIAQPDFTRRDSTADGTIRTLSRIDREFVNLPMAEARDFHCYSHVLENLGERSIPSDHAAARVVIHPVLCSILKQISDDHQYHRGSKMANLTLFHFE